MDEKAQTSIEVLLLLGGAIAIATVVGLYLKDVSKTAAGKAASQ